LKKPNKQGREKKRAFCRTDGKLCRHKGVLTFKTKRGGERTVYLRSGKAERRQEVLRPGGKVKKNKIKKKYPNYKSKNKKGANGNALATGFGGKGGQTSTKQGPQRTKKEGEGRRGKELPVHQACSETERTKSKKAVWQLSLCRGSVNKKKKRYASPSQDLRKSQSRPSYKDTLEKNKRESRAHQIAFKHKTLKMDVRPLSSKPIWWVCGKKGGAVKNHSEERTKCILSGGKQGVREKLGTGRPKKTSFPPP